MCGLTDLVALQVAAIHREAFAGSSVSSVFIPDTVARVGEAAFSRCFRLQGVVCHAQVLERECFKCCYALETVVLGGQLRVVPASAFQFCDALQSVDLSGSSLTAIKKVAFCNCESLKKIVIPKQVAEINARAFQGCTSLETVDFERWSPCIPAFATAPLSSKRTRVSCVVAGILASSTSKKGRFRTVGALPRFVFREAFETLKT